MKTLVPYGALYDTKNERYCLLGSFFHRRKETLRRNKGRFNVMEYSYLRGLMKTPSQDLYKLIHSLSKTEKRYFKSISALHGKEDNKYLLLFDAIAKQKKFDDEELKNQFKGEAFTKQFPVAKNYLYSRILDALELYHRDSSTHSSVRRNIYRAEILQKKGMYDQSMKPLQKAREDALAMDLFHAMIEINTQWEFNAHIEKYDLKKLEQLHADVIKTSALLTEAINCRDLSLKMVTLFNHYFQTRNNKFLKEADELIKHPLIKKAEEIKSFSGRVRIYETKFFYWYAKGNLEAACAEGEKAVKLCLTSDLQMKNHVKFYMVLLSNLFYLRSEQKDFKRAYAHLAQLEKAIPYLQTYSQKAKYFYSHDNAMVYYLYNTGKLKELEKKLPAVISEFEKYKSELSHFEQIAMLSYVAISFFYLGNLKMSIQYLNLLRNEYDLAENPEAQYFLNIFYLIAHYEAGHHEILPYLVQSFHRFLRKKDHVTKIETVMVDLLKRPPKKDTEKKSIDEFNAIKKEIATISHDHTHRYIFKYFDLNSWLESKMKNKSFQEIIKEKSTT